MQFAAALLAAAPLGTSYPSLGSWSALPQAAPARKMPAGIAGEILLSAKLIGTAFLLDKTVGTNFPDRGANNLVEEPGELFGGSTFLLGSAGGVAATGLALRRPPLLRTGKELGLAIAGASMVTWTIKEITGRERPDGSNRRSFPSGHSAGAFAAASVVEREVGGAAGWLAYGAAASAAYARVADNKHFFSDVVAGALLGRLMGRLVTHRRVVAAETAIPDETAATDR